MARMEWTQENDDRLRKLWAEGKSTRLIGERMGITKNAVVGRAHRLALSSRPAPVLRGDRSPGAVSKREATRQKALELYQGGMQRAQIAARLELSPDYVSNLLRGVSQRKGRAPVTASAEHAPKATGPVLVASSAPTQPPVQFQPIAPRCCRWPMWGNAERPTHRYCEQPTTLRRDGVPDVYCAAHRAKSTARTIFPVTYPRSAA